MDGGSGSDAPAQEAPSRRGMTMKKEEEVEGKKNKVLFSFLQNSKIL